MMRTTYHQPRAKNQEPKSKSQRPTNELGIWFLVIGIWFLVVGPKPVARQTFHEFPFLPKMFMNNDRKASLKGADFLPARGFLIPCYASATPIGSPTSPLLRHS